MAWVDPDRGFDDYTNGGAVGNETTTTSLAFSSTGQPAIAYYDKTYQRLRYASCAGTCTSAASWSNIIVDATGNVGQFASLALSPLASQRDRPRIAYLGNDSPTTLRYVWLGDSGWSIGQLDGSAGFVSLRLTPADGRG